MEPKTIVETGKALVELLKAVLDFIGSNKLTKSESQRLFAFYIAIQEYMEIKQDYFLFLNSLTTSEEDQSSLLWQAKKLSHLMATRHFEAYRLSGGLDFQIRAHEHTLHDLLKVYKTRVSKSLGFGPKDVAISYAYKSIASTNIKIKHFSATYKISFKDGKFFVGELPVGDNQSYKDFVRLHEESDEFMENMMKEFDDVVRRHIESDKSHNNEIQPTQKTRG